MNIAAAPRTPPASSGRRWAALLLVAAGSVVFGCDRRSPEPAPRTTPAPPAAVSEEAVEAALTAADQYLNAQEIEKAEAILTRLVTRAPAEGRARELLGQVLTLRASRAERRGERDAAVAARLDALEQYRAAVALDPDSAGLHHSAGVVAMAAGQADAALELFGRASRLAPENPQHPLYAAQVLIQQQQFAAAEEALRAVLALDPDEPVAHASLAIVAIETGRVDDAMAAIGEARAIAPRDLRFRAQEARIHRRAGDPQRALELLTALTPRERLDPAVAAEVAASFSAVGDHGSAAEVWAEQFRQRSEHPDAYRLAVQAGHASLEAGERGRAVWWVEQARLLGGLSPEVRALEERLRGDGGEAARPAGAGGTEHRDDG
jgi:predicted Zn-dependent protease